MSYDYIDTLSRESRERYEVKLTASGVKECPYRLPGDVWLEDMTQWPEVTFGDLYMYLTTTPGVFTQQAMKSYKSLEAHRYFTAGFVQTVRHIKAGSVTVFRANVRPSQRSNDPSHLPWVSVNEDGQVIAGHCTCMAGLGESCSHIAAVLFKLEAAVKLGLTTVACTSKQCEWNNFYTDKVKPAPIKDIQFYSPQATAKVATSGRKRRRTADMSPPTEEQKRAFLESLSTSNKLPVVMSLFASTSQKFKSKREMLPRQKMPHSLRTLYSANYRTLSAVELECKVKDAINSTVISAEQSKNIEGRTHAQANCVTWHEQRAGRITASVAYSVLHTNQVNPAVSVIKGITIIRTSPIMSEALKYGREKKIAFQLYLKMISDCHVNATLEKTGMVIDPEHPWLSASADGFIRCDCHDSSVLEIKSPYTARHLSPEEYINDPNSFIFNGSLVKSHKYYTQVQIQMFVYKVEFCDFVVFVGDSLITTEVVKDAEYLRNVLPQLRPVHTMQLVV